MTVTRLPARYLRLIDRIPDDAATVALGPVDPAPVLGMWHNTNRATCGISRAELSSRDGRIWMRVWGVDPLADPPAGPYDWGAAALERLYTDGPCSSRVAGYTVRFELDHAHTLIQASMAHGVTILAATTRFTDGSGRANYMSREYFHRRGDRS